MRLDHFVIILCFLIYLTARRADEINYTNHYLNAILLLLISIAITIRILGRNVNKK